eukprot:365644-Chlamydomonas_euryale.AAC.12
MGRGVVRAPGVGGYQGREARPRMLHPPDHAPPALAVTAGRQNGRSSMLHPPTTHLLRLLEAKRPVQHAAPPPNHAPTALAVTAGRQNGRSRMLRPPPNHAPTAFVVTAGRQNGRSSMLPPPPQPRTYCACCDRRRDDAERLDLGAADGALDRQQQLLRAHV